MCGVCGVCKVGSIDQKGGLRGSLDQADASELRRSGTDGVCVRCVWTTACAGRRGYPDGSCPNWGAQIDPGPLGRCFVGRPATGPRPLERESLGGTRTPPSQSGANIRGCGRCCRAMRWTAAKRHPVQYRGRGPVHDWEGARGIWDSLRRDWIDRCQKGGSSGPWWRAPSHLAPSSPRPLPPSKKQDGWVELTHTVSGQQILIKSQAMVLDGAYRLRLRRFSAAAVQGRVHKRKPSAVSPRHTCVDRPCGGSRAGRIGGPSIWGWGAYAPVGCNRRLNRLELIARKGEPYVRSQER